MVRQIHSPPDLFLGGSLTDSVYLSFLSARRMAIFLELNDSSDTGNTKCLTTAGNVWFTRNTEGDVNQPFRTAMVPGSG